MSLLTLQDLDVENKNILLRVDFNVPLKEDGSIADLMRIKESLPSIEFLLQKKAKVILLSHLGRPKGKRDLKYSLKPCAEALSKMLKQEILFLPEPLANETKIAIDQMKPGTIALLENLRFYEAEEKPDKDPSFAQHLAMYGDIFVNDAFSASHRDHSSITYLARCFPKYAAAGFLLEKEIKMLTPLYTNPQKPFHAILGGAKISSKLGVIQTLLEKVDALYIGGAMSFTFFKALNRPIGNSLFEPDLVETAKKIISLCKEKNVSLLLPEDTVIVPSITETAPRKTVNLFQEEVLDGWQGVDIGPQTLLKWKASLQTASTIFWNGPLGVFELKPFAQGTFDLIYYLSTLSSTRIVGGGDSAAAIHELNLSKNFTFISTGGGASLEFIEQGGLPGINALTLKK